MVEEMFRASAASRAKTCVWSIMSRMPAVGCRSSQWSRPTRWRPTSLEMKMSVAAEDRVHAPRGPRAELVVAVGDAVRRVRVRRDRARDEAPEHCDQRLVLDARDGRRQVVHGLRAQDLDVGPREERCEVRRVRRRRHEREEQEAEAERAAGTAEPLEVVAGEEQRRRVVELRRRGLDARRQGARRAVRGDGDGERDDAADDDRRRDREPEPPVERVEDGPGARPRVRLPRQPRERVGHERRARHGDAVLLRRELEDDVAGAVSQDLGPVARRGDHHVLDLEVHLCG